MGRSGRTNPEDGWPPELTPPGEVPAAIGDALAQMEKMLTAIVTVGNAQGNAIRRFRALSERDGRIVDGFLEMIASGRMTFESQEARREALHLTRQLLEQLRLHEEIITDLATIAADEAERVMPKGGRKTG